MRSCVQVRAERSETTTRQRCPKGEAKGRINPARPTTSKKKAPKGRFLRFRNAENFLIQILRIPIQIQIQIQLHALRLLGVGPDRPEARSRAGLWTPRSFSLSTISVPEDEFVPVAPTCGVGRGASHSPHFVRNPKASCSTPFCAAPMPPILTLNKNRQLPGPIYDPSKFKIHNEDTKPKS